MPEPRPDGCRICKGSPNDEETLIYQIVDGKLRLAYETVLGIPFIFIHSRCRNQLIEAHGL